MSLLQGVVENTQGHPLEAPMFRPWSVCVRPHWNRGLSRSQESIVKPYRYSLSVSLSNSLCPSLSLSLCVSLALALRLALAFALALALALSLPLPPSLSLSVGLSVSLSLSLGAPSPKRQQKRPGDLGLLLKQLLATFTWSPHLAGGSVKGGPSWGKPPYWCHLGVSDN